MRYLSAQLILIAALSTTAAANENSPRFRGLQADGVAGDDSRLPDSWTATQNVKWVVSVPGWGWSCPVVWDDKVFLTTVVGEEENEQPKKGLYLGQGVRTPAKGLHHWMVYCFDAQTGRELWKHEAHRGRPQVPRHPKSTYAAETPVTDGERLYALFGDVGLYCYSLDGQQVWAHDIEPKKTMRDYGAAASPVIYDGQVFVLYDNQEASYLASFDAATGERLWRVDREEKTTWATPFIWEHDRVELVTCGKYKNRSYDLRGNLLWEFEGRMSNLIVPSPFAAHGMLYITSGYIGDAHRPVYAIAPGAAGDITLDEGQKSNDFIKWYQPTAGPYNTSPIVYGDYYYTLYDRGFLTCHNALTGEQVYGKKRFAPGASFTASPWAYNGQLFFLSEDGDTFVVDAGPDYKLIRKNPLNELCIATPAVADGNLLVRTASKLYCISNSR